MLLALGQFTFEIGTAAFLELSRRREWRHEAGDRIGVAPAYQALGPGAEPISLTGIVAPGISGKHSALDTLEEMGDANEALPLVDARGRIYGQFVITALDRKTTEFLGTGEARRADFTLELTRVG
ncbi:MAG: oxidoreductase [Citromicrobium sp.]|nr:oxidoreductase [Citromicrobium sp.]